MHDSPAQWSKFLLQLVKVQFTDWLIYWLTDWLTDGRTDRPTDWKKQPAKKTDQMDDTDQGADWLTDSPTDKLNNFILNLPWQNQLVAKNLLKL